MKQTTPQSPQVITHLQNHFLVATPKLDDTEFEKSVVYVCTHNGAEGAMGMVVNHPLDDVSFDEIADSMGVEELGAGTMPIIYNGGPVAEDHGFVIHSDDYVHENTLMVGGHVSLSASADIVMAIAGGRGPHQVNFCLGYAGWEPGQLEEEIAGNSWLVMPATEMVLFNLPPEKRYEACIGGLGLTPLNYNSRIQGAA